MSTKKKMVYGMPLYVVSCRKRFESMDEASAALQYAVHRGGVEDIRERITLSGLRAAVARQHVCILVHGFNNKYAELLEAYRSMQAEMQARGLIGKDGYGLVIGFAWPSCGDSKVPRPLTEFKKALKSADACEAFLNRLIRNVRAGAKSVDVQTHSLGARVALRALLDIELFVDNLLLSAPAVPHDVFEPRKVFHESLDNCGRCYVYHSKRDDVLRYTYPIGENGLLQKALGYGGPANKQKTLEKTPNVYVMNAQKCVNAHSGYRKAVVYYHHWLRILKGDTVARYETLPKS